MSSTKRWFAAAAAWCFLLVGAAGAHAQCMLANPSFEIPGSSGTVFAGWNQFGPVSSSPNAVHGSKAALVTGPNTHAWAVSGVWQSIPCTPGQQWVASTMVLNTSSAPLTGGCTAILNVEWHDSADNLISYESHTAADASAPTDRWLTYGVTTGAAPAGTASLHYVLGVLQSPTDPTPMVEFDLPNFYPAGPPTHETLQWSDFSSGRTLSFSGRTWRVKGPGYLGPGPNYFDNGVNATWVDAQGRLHLTIKKSGTTWYSTEIALDTALGYGDYVFTTRGKIDLLDRNTILGMFIWEYGACYDSGHLWWNPYNEIDVEFSRWGNAAAADAQFVAQPGGGGNILRFNAAFADSEEASHAFRWLPDRVEYRSWRGGPDAERTSVPIASWTYTGTMLPRPEAPRVHLNMWQIGAPPATQEAVLDAFTFRPACPSGTCGPLAVPPSVPVAEMHASAAPNPFGAATTIRYALALAGRVDLRVFDLAGRQVRQLVNGAVPAGEHAVPWDGRDDSGQRVRPGVYLYRVRTGGVAEARRVVVLD